MNMLRFCYLLTGVTLITHSACMLFAQATPAESPKATFRINARTVIEDVVVMGKDGHAVTGLHKDDFRIFENGKPQTITYFDQNLADQEISVAAPVSLPPGTFTNVPATPPNGVTYVLLLDALNTWPEDRMYAQVQMVKYLASLPPNLQIGIFTLTDEKLNLIQGFNQDSSMLRKAVATFTLNNSHSSSHSIFAQRRALTAALDQVKQSADDTRLAESVNALQQFLRKGPGIIDSHNQLVTTLNALQALAHYFAGVPGRKNLFWLVGNFPICIPAEPFLCPYLDLYGQTKDKLAEAGVSIYPIDAGGVNVDMGIGPSAFEHQPSARLINSETWAEDTGGKAFHGNDIHQEIADAADHGSRYYRLAYVPSDHREEDRERKIEIKVLSGDYKLFYRQRYFEQTRTETAKAEAAPSRDPLIALMGRGMPNIGELPYRLKVVKASTQPNAGTPRAGANAQLSGNLTRYDMVFQLLPSGFSSLRTDADGDGGSAWR